MKRVLWLIPLVCVLWAAPSKAATNHGLSGVYHWSHIKSEEGQKFNFHAPGISYSLATGKDIGFLGRFTLFFPRALYQDGSNFGAKDFYDAAWGFEALVGASKKFALPRDLRLIVGLGAHLNNIRLDSDEYETFHSTTLGLGLDGELLYPVHPNFAIGGYLLFSGHFIDLIHSGNALAYAFFVNVGLTVEFHLGADS